MTTLRSISVVATAMCLLSVAFAQEQKPDPTGGWGLGSPFNRHYDPAAEITFKGRVTGVNRLTPKAGMSPGVMLLVATANGGTAVVELGPQWYLDNQPFKIRLKDRLSVTGCKVFENGKSSIVARKIVLDNRVAYLRGVDGFPMWIASRGHVDVMPAGNRPERVFEGRITRFERVEVGESGFASTLVQIETAKGAFAIDVGPRWFIERQDVLFRVGDDLVVDAVRVEPRSGKSPLIIARRVRLGHAELVLRPESGRPVWAGMGGG